MSIEFLNGDLLAVKEGIIVHGCNMQGVMGGGVALQIKQKYPGCYKAYKKQLSLKKLGECIWYPVSESLWIVNALTQELYGLNRVQVDYPALSSCFDIVFDYARRSDQNVHLPDMIGCGLAGGDRDIVVTLLEKSIAKNNFMNCLTVWKL